MAALYIIDYVIFTAILAVSLGIGTFYSFRQKNTSEYFHGQRLLQLFPTAISITVTFVSAHSLLGTPAEIFFNGTQFSMHVIGGILGNIFGALLYVPLFQPLQITSVFEYVELRYRSRSLKLLATVTKLMSKAFLNGVGIYGPSVSLHTMTGLPVWSLMLICGITTTIYTTIGGIKSVIWSDVFQALFVYIGMTVICIFGFGKVGGFNNAIKYNQEWERLNFFDSVWSCVVGYGTVAFCWSTVQSSVLRYSSLPTLRKAKQAVLLSAVGVATSAILFVFAGFVAFAYYAKKSCDPLRGGLIQSPNQILPFFVMEIFEATPGLPGLFVACLASTALSSTSSILNGSAAIIWKDFLSLRFKHKSEKTKATISKITVACAGTAAIAAGFLVMNLKGTLIRTAVGIGGGLLGSIAGLHFVGAVNPRVNAKAAAIGFVVSLSFVMTLVIGSNFVTQPTTHILPYPVSGCYANDSVITDRSSNFSHIEEATTPLTTPFIYNNSTHSAPRIGFFKSIFTIPFLNFPFIGISTITILASLLSIHPYFAADYFVEDEHLFPFVRFLRKRFFGKASKKSKHGDKEKEHSDYEMEPLDANDKGLSSTAKEVQHHNEEKSPLNL